MAEHGFTGSYYSVRRFVTQLAPKQELPFRRLECGPGEEAQVDFGTGAPIVAPDGERQRTHVLRVVLSHSRKAYSEVVYRQTPDDFLRCLHGTTRKEVAPQFALEKPKLLPLPDAWFPCFGEVKRTVHRDGHVEVAKAYYLVPPEFLGRRVWVRYDARLVRIFDERMKSIAVHVRHELGRFSTQSSHIAGPKINSVHRTLRKLLERPAPRPEPLPFLDEQAIKFGYAVLYRSIFDLIRDFLQDEALGGTEKVLARYLKPDCSSSTTWG